MHCCLGFFCVWVDFNHYNCFGRRLFKIFSHVYLILKYFLTQKIGINFESEFGFSGVVKILTVSDAEKNVRSRSAIFEGGSFRSGYSKYEKKKPKRRARVLAKKHYI